MSYKYYSTQRPIAPGTFPKPDNNKVVGLENFDDRIYCEDIQLYAWGYIEYEKPLTQYDCNSYELIPVKTKVLHLRYIGKDSWSRYVYEDENGRLWKLTDCCSPRKCCKERGDVPRSTCNNAFDGEPDCPMATYIKPEYVS